MSLKNRMNALADKVRAIPSRPGLDERPTSVTVRTIVYEGGRVGAEGTTHTTDLPLLPIPYVKDVDQKDITQSGGRYIAGDVKVGPITPFYGSGGYTEAQLAPVKTTNGTKIIYVLTGQLAGEYDRVALDNERTHSWYLILRRLRSTPS